MFKINSLHEYFFNMKYWFIIRYGPSKSIHEIFCNMKIKYGLWNSLETAWLRNNQNIHQERERGLTSPLNSGGAGSMHDCVCHLYWTSKKMKKKPPNSPSLCESEPHTNPWMSCKWRRNSSMKVAKTNKSQTTRANQQQHQEKNDFYAWKVPLSPLACL